MDSRLKFSPKVVQVIQDDIARYQDTWIEEKNVSKNATVELIGFALGTTRGTIEGGETFENSFLQHCAAISTDPLCKELATINVDGNAHYYITKDNVAFSYMDRRLTKKHAEAIEATVKAHYPDVLISSTTGYLTNTMRYALVVSFHRMPYIKNILPAIVNAFQKPEEMKEEKEVKSTPDAARLAEENFQKDLASILKLVTHETSVETSLIDTYISNFARLLVDPVNAGLVNIFNTHCRIIKELRLIVHNLTTNTIMQQEAINNFKILLNDIPLIAQEETRFAFDEFFIREKHKESSPTDEFKSTLPSFGRASLFAPAAPPSLHSTDSKPEPSLRP